MGYSQRILYFLLFINSILYAQKIDEKLLIILPKTNFTFGEKINFQLHLNARDTSNQSHVVYVELISPSKKLISEKTFKIYDYVNSDFKIDSSFEKGKYSIRAYTNFIAGYGQNAVFKKDIFINSEENQNNYSLNFSGIEGGNLVKNIPAKIIFKHFLKNSLWQLIDEEGNVNLEFKTNDVGVKVFPFTPQNTLKYKFVCKEQKVQIPIPEIKENGITSLFSVKKEEIFCKIYSTEILEDSLFLYSYFEDEVINVQKFKNNTITLLKFNSKLLPNGLIEFKIINSSFKVLSSRTWLNTNEFENYNEQFFNLDFYFKNKFQSLTISEINDELLINQKLIFNKNNQFEKEQFLIRTGIAKNYLNKIIKDDDIFMIAESKSLGYRRIKTNELGVFSIPIKNEIGYVELRILDNDSKPIVVKWLPRGVLPLDEKLELNLNSVSFSGLDLPVNYEKTLDEVKILGSYDFTDIKRKVGSTYLTADREIYGNILKQRSFSDQTPLTAISSSFPNMILMNDPQTLTPWLYRMRGNRYEPIIINIDGINYPIGSSLPLVQSIYKIEMKTTGLNFGAYIYTNALIEVMGGKKKPTRFESNAIVFGFDL